MSNNKVIRFFSKLLLMIALKGTVISGNIGYEYYWRDYDFVNIPNDAMEVGVGSGTYIAQVDVYDKGIFIGTLHRGQHFLEVSAYGDAKPTENIKILCTANPPESMWLDTTTETFHSDINGQYPLNGGWDSVNHRYISIGRAVHAGQWIAGSVNSFEDQVHLYYAYEDQEYKVSTFQVLVDPSSK